MALPQVTIVGNVVADPDMKFLNNGNALANFRVAANSRKKDENGNWTDGDSTFLSVTAFGGLAENVTEQLHKGTKVIVTGRLTQRDVEKDGQKRTYYGVTADDIGIQISRFADKGQGFPQAGQNFQQQAQSMTAPF